MSARNVDMVTLAQSRWLCLQRIDYVNRHGVKHDWYRSIRTPAPIRLEMIEKKQSLLIGDECTVKEDGKDPKIPDATTVIALCFKSSNKHQNSLPLRERDDVEIILVKQFRPAVSNYTLEFPAGLVDAGEDPVQCGLRELTEETGYTAKRILDVSPTLTLSPGNTSESVIIVTVSVDLDDKANANPTQNLDENEDIEVVRIPLKKLMEELNRFQREDNGVLFVETYGKLSIASSIVKSGVAFGLYTMSEIRLE